MNRMKRPFMLDVFSGQTQTNSKRWLLSFPLSLITHITHKFNKTPTERYRRETEMDAKWIRINHVTCFSFSSLAHSQCVVSLPVLFPIWFRYFVYFKLDSVVVRNSNFLRFFLSFFCVTVNVEKNITKREIRALGKFFHTLHVSLGCVICKSQIVMFGLAWISFRYCQPGVWVSREFSIRFGSVLVLLMTDGAVWRLFAKLCKLDSTQMIDNFVSSRETKLEMKEKNFRSSRMRSITLKCSTNLDERFSDAIDNFELFNEYRLKKRISKCDQ